MGLRVVAGARRDFRNSITWYQREAGMGAEFIAAVEDAYSRIESDPNTLPSAENPWPTRGRDIRRCPVDGFPYQVIYEIQHTGVVVLAIAHGSRRPGYWSRRKG